MTRYLTIALAVLVVTLAMLALYFRGAAAVSVDRQHIAEQRADQLGAALKSSEAARVSEHAQADKLQAIAQQYEQDKTDAQAKADRTIADLRAGTVRLRNEWQGCPARGVPATAGSTGQPDAGAELRAKGAGDLIGNAAAADAEIRRLQDILKAERQP
jgi:uncharacterized protein involved in exopolysaccharide biosynthesis